jgi:hypothetical protein
MSRTTGAAARAVDATCCGCRCSAISVRKGTADRTPRPAARRGVRAGRAVCDLRRRLPRQPRPQRGLHCRRPPGVTAPRTCSPSYEPLAARCGAGRFVGPVLSADGHAPTSRWAGRLGSVRLSSLRVVSRCRGVAQPGGCEAGTLMLRSRESNPTADSTAASPATPGECPGQRPSRTPRTSPSPDMVPHPIPVATFTTSSCSADDA